MKRAFKGGAPIYAISTLLLSALGLVGSASAKGNQDTAVPRAPDAIYQRTCGYCHGHNVGPVIRGRNLPAEAISYMVRNGQGAMPAFRPTEISDAELKLLSLWVSRSKADPKEHGQ